jgi:hypothetical protein
MYNALGFFTSLPVWRISADTEVFCRSQRRYFGDNNTRNNDICCILQQMCRIPQTSLVWDLCSPHPDRAEQRKTYRAARMATHGVIGHVGRVPSGVSNRQRGVSFRKTPLSHALPCQSGIVRYLEARVTGPLVCQSCKGSRPVPTPSFALLAKQQ